MKFGTKVLFLAVTLIAIGIAILLKLPEGFDPWYRHGLWYIGGISIGSGCGLLFRRPIIGAAVFCMIQAIVYHAVLLPNSWLE